MITEVFKAIGAYGPQYILLALVVIAFWQSGAMKELFTKKGEYVLRDHCHNHIDELKKEIGNTRTDLKEHINGVDEKVNLLLQNALKGRDK